MKGKLTLLALAVWSVAAMPALGQVTGSASGSNPGGAPGGSPESRTDVGKTANMADVMNQARPGNFVSGKVQVKGGELPWEYVPVVVTCNGKQKYAARAGAKGGFYIAPSMSSDVAAETMPTNPASTGKTTFASDLIGCQVTAAVAGYDSSTLTIPNRDITDNPDIGTITLTRESGEGNGLSATTANAPKDAKKAYDKARSDWLDKKPDKAQKELEKATQAYPQYAEAWYQMGKMQELQSKPQDAYASYSKAVGADPKFELPYDRMAAISAQAGNWQQVAEATGHSLELNPRGSPQTLYFNAFANYKMGKKDVAEESAKKALAEDPLHTVPNTEQLLAVILADKKDYAGALQHLKSAETYLPKGPNLDLVKQQIAQLEPMVNQQSQTAQPK